ncbi:MULTISPECIES: PTS lactose/cellobiose transporter subunit IIA [unclassified Exiguobacterium]|uniref:PTS lactose/cellobiose transporter subunit IIA n=1 Tax=unclassified Exiguobacterium TaxID=2644629 RepID=UPI001BE8D2D7|nr:MULTISPECIES: PTS lactose/cellobiose transporter subunit IIA [unclassified Exiguobacterium]
MTEELQILSFTMILHAGNARSAAMESIQAAKKGDLSLAQIKLEEANQESLQAHRAQTTLLQDEAKGLETPLSILLIHAQDHLMTAMTVRDLASEMVELYTRLTRLEEKL